MPARLVLTALIAALAGSVATGAYLNERARWLAAIDFRLVYPEVPAEILAAVREAEAGYYSDRGLLLVWSEEAQDLLTFLGPGLTYRLDLSVGPYRIKASTIESLLPWAVENGYLVVEGAPEEHVLQALAYFAEQPGLARWGVAAILEQLRQRHPELRGMAWDEIAADRRLVAKLYSGYMGAGGDWSGWAESIEPGPEAQRRLGLAEDRGV
ncbi:hypothetical protein [Wenxinia marina]|uniref:Uncharacterized protein n=1 Tax=Wenxinia marina DSM 24838 TaxID=1123501 RepID=A0A0D0Q0F2_9RHOB|nr:hypothetical protein [Wenxinia marina]KIQ68064.1 hypothetical protein Wenmar_03279 [Wenxinia marina DSM 24838]GGL77916.1 hypothetical protein GCM10011392_35580 [Wenxinia marina]